MANEPERIDLHTHIVDPAERQDLVTHLEHQVGIIQAVYDADADRRLHVVYDPEHFSPTTLLDFVRLHGVEAELIQSR